MPMIILLRNWCQKLLPEVLPTQESPLTYNYRTKLTPHFIYLIRRQVKICRATKFGNCIQR